MKDTFLLANTPVKPAVQATYRCVDQLQGYPPHVQLLAAALLILSVTKVHRIPPQDVFTYAKNMIVEKGEKVDELRALDLYAKMELAPK